MISCATWFADAAVQENAAASLSGQLPIQNFLLFNCMEVGAARKALLAEEGLLCCSEQLVPSVLGIIPHSSGIVNAWALIG